MTLIDKVIGFSIRSRIFIFGGAATLLGVGLWALSTIPFEAFPDITANSVSVITEAPGLAPQEVEQLVTFPIERSLLGLPDANAVRSTTKFGLVIQLQQNATGAGDAAAREGVGVDVGGADHAERIRHLSPVGPGRHRLAHLAHVGVQGAVLGGPEVRRELHGRISSVHLDLLFFGDHHQLAFAGDRVGGAAGGGTGGRDTRQPHELTAGQPVSIPQGTIV